MKCGLAFKIYPHWTLRDLEQQISSAKKAK